MLGRGRGVLCGRVRLSPSPRPAACSLQKATALPARRAEYFDGSEPVQNRVYKSLKVWSMLADLEESLGTFQVSRGAEGPWSVARGQGRSLCPGRALTCCCPQSTKAVYDRILDLRIATPQIVINYAMFLEEHKYFEESFKVRGADLEVPDSGVSCPGAPAAVSVCSGGPNKVSQRRALRQQRRTVLVLGAGSLRLWCWRGWSLPRPLSLASGRLSSHRCVYVS